MAKSDPDTIEKEKQLFLDFQAGKLVVFDYFFDKYYQGLCVYAYHFLKSTEESEDIVSDFFVRILENRKNIVIGKSVKSYFIRAVHNRCLDCITYQGVRTRWKQDVTSRHHEEELDAYPLLDRELEEKIKQAIQHLPNVIRETFLLNRFDGLKYQQIAEKENISVKTVEYRIGKALGFLRKELGDYLALLILLT